MTGFLFGLGLVIALAQLPNLLGVAGGERQLLPGARGTCSASSTRSRGRRSRSARLARRAVSARRCAAVPSTLLVLVARDRRLRVARPHRRGVDVVGDIPAALPDLAIPDVGADDLVQLIAPALGMLIVSAEAVGVARGLAVQHGYQVDPNRDLVAMGAQPVAGLSSGFVQSGGASQTAAADGAGGRSQLASDRLRRADPVDRRVPRAAVHGPAAGDAGGDRDRGGSRVLRRRELRRFARVRRSAVLLAGLALAACWRSACCRGSSWRRG